MKIQIPWGVTLCCLLSSSQCFKMTVPSPSESNLTAWPMIKHALQWTPIFSHTTVRTSNITLLLKRLKLFIGITFISVV
jgi:hypothetical protein